MLTAAMVPPVQKSFLDLIHPSLMFLRLVSVMDEGIDEFLNLKRLVVPTQYPIGLHGKLQFLHDERAITYTSDVIKIRQRRNQIAHEMPDYSSPETIVSWNELDNAIYVVEELLKKLNVITGRPEFDFEWGRDVDMYLQKPNPEKPDVIMTHHYYFGVKEHESWVVKINQSIDYHKVIS